MKNFEVNMNISISTSENYTTTYPLKFSISESLPANTDPQKYMRKRISEELTRHFNQLVTPIDNFNEDGKEKAKDADPLEPESF